MLVPLRPIINDPLFAGRIPTKSLFSGIWMIEMPELILANKASSRGASGWRLILQSSRVHNILRLALKEPLHILEANVGTLV